MAQSWITGFLDWLKKLLGVRSNSVAAIEILEEYHSDRVSVFRLRNDSIPGCVEFWKVDHHHESSTFWICCLNLATLRVALAELGTSPTAFLKSHHRGVADSIEVQLQEQNKYLASHYWITGLTKPYAGIDAKGRHYKTFRTVSTCLLAGDFQGIAASYAGDRYIRRFAREIAGRVANCEFREYKNHSTWTAAVKSINWLEWLEGLSRGTKGIDPDHCFQPLKSKSQRQWGTYDSR